MQSMSSSLELVDGQIDSIRTDKTVDNYCIQIVRKLYFTTSATTECLSEDMLPFACERNFSKRTILSSLSCLLFFQFLGPKKESFRPTCE